MRFPVARAALAAALLTSTACGDRSSTRDATDAVADATDDAVAADGSDDTRLDAHDGSGASPDTTVDAPPGCLNAGTDGATALCLTPTQTPEYYVDQALRYFDTLDVDADPASVPNYSELVARWVWPPWLLLTGFGRDTMNDSATLLRQFDPSTVPERDCRYFATQPFARCYISFAYEGGPCPIYEEFVFNDAGEMTFIEAWSNLEGLTPTGEDDPWGEREGFQRLSTRVPGLGNPDGRIDIESSWMVAAAAVDTDIADFVERADDFWATWFDEFTGADDDFFAVGCGWQ
jgi:hypothetical protein